MASSVALPLSALALLIISIRLFLHYGDIADSTNPIKLLYRLQPDEIYHLAAQSHLRVSFDIPEYTGNVTGTGHGADFGGDSGDRTQDEIFSGEQFGDVWQSAGGSTAGNHTVLPTQSLWRGEALRLLGHRQLPREL